MAATYLTLETFTGHSITDACRDAVGVANTLKVWVKININGIETLVAPGDYAHVIEANWRKALERGATFVSANVIPQGKTGGESAAPDQT